MAVFDPVEIDGCQVSRASLHNLSFIEGLELVPGNRIMVSKRNQIIPHIEENLDRGKFALDAVVPPPMSMLWSANPHPSDRGRHPCSLL